MDIDLKGIMDAEECASYKEVVSPFGLTVVCDEEDELEANKNDAIVLPDTEECESVVQVASVDGVKILCSDEEES